MAPRLHVRDQHIAVFGGSGSGKTVLVSSFYGAAQEQEFLKQSFFRVVAEDTGLGNALRQNFLGMKNRAIAPVPTRFKATSCAFTVMPKVRQEDQRNRSAGFDALRLVWHDYPGEWFEEEPSSLEEYSRRVETFRSLLQSDVALLLIDGQKLLDHAGEEERYLKSVFWMVRDGLLRLRGALLADGKPLRRFPRTWVIALSKADLHPALDVHAFQDLVVEKAAGDIEALREVVKEFVAYPQALSIGEDFVRLSSARFEPTKIVVGERVGLDLILPMAAILPLERVVRWGDRLDVPRKAVGDLVENAKVVSTLLVAIPVARRLMRRVPKFGRLTDILIGFTLEGFVKATPQKIGELNRAARDKHNFMVALLTRLRLDLDRGVADDVLVKSGE